MKKEYKSTPDELNKVFEAFERELVKYYRSIEEQREYSDSEYAKVSECLSYGKCNGIFLALENLGHAEEFFKWAKAKKLNYYDVLKFAPPEEYTNDIFKSLDSAYVDM